MDVKYSAYRFTRIAILSAAALVAVAPASSHAESRGLPGSTNAASEVEQLLLSGPIESSNVAHGTITVLGQTVLLPRGQSMEAVVGNVANVFGHMDSDGSYLVSSITVSDAEYVPGATRVALIGRVSEIDQSLGIAKIGNQFVDYTSALHSIGSGELNVGDVVAVAGLKYSGNAKLYADVLTSRVSGAGQTGSGKAFVSDGQTGSGKSLAGQTGSGKYLFGQTGSGHSIIADGQTGSGRAIFANGQTGSGKTAAGQTGSGKAITVNGQTGSGKVANGQTGSGRIANGQTGSGKTLAGQTGSGKYLNGQTGSGHSIIANGQTGSGRAIFANGQTGSGKTAAGQTGSGKAIVANGQTGSGKTADGQTGSGKALSVSGQTGSG